MKSKIITKLLTGLIIMMVAGCNMQTDSRNTYKNESYGYSFQYPSSCFYGPMPSDCKQKPPEERRQECLCFLNGEDTKSVFMQAYVGKKEELSLAEIRIRYLEFVPGVVDLVGWLKASYIKDIVDDIPDEPNTQLGEIPAVRIYRPSQGVYSYETIYYTKYNRIFEIGLLNVDNQANKAFYNKILSTFKHSEAPISEKGMLIP